MSIKDFIQNGFGRPIRVVGMESDIAQVTDQLSDTDIELDAITPDLPDNDTPEMETQQTDQAQLEELLKYLAQSPSHQNLLFLINRDRFEDREESTMMLLERMQQIQQRNPNRVVAVLTPIMSEYGRQLAENTVVNRELNAQGILTVESLSDLYTLMGRLYPKSE